MSRLGTGAGRVGVLSPWTSPHAQAQVLVSFLHCSSLVSRGREPGGTASRWGLLPCGGLVAFRHTWHPVGCPGPGLLEEAAQPHSRGEGRALAGLSVEWSGVWFPPGSEGGVCFSLFPLEAVLLLDVGGALSGSVFCWDTVCPDTDKPVQSGCGTGEREAGLGGCWPRGWPRKHQTTRVCCPWDPGPAHPLRALHPLRPLCCPHGPTGASCTLRGTSESLSVTKPPDLVLGRRACGVPAPPPPPPQGESR